MQAAVRLCGAAGSMIGFVDADRTWLKAAHGISRAEVPKSASLVPIVGRDGLPLGAVGVFDREPREFCPTDLGVLAALADLTVALAGAAPRATRRPGEARPPAPRD